MKDAPTSAVTLDAEYNSFMAELGDNSSKDTGGAGAGAGGSSIGNDTSTGTKTNTSETAKPKQTVITLSHVLTGSTPPNAFSMPQYAPGLMPSMANGIPTAASYMQPGGSYLPQYPTAYPGYNNIYGATVPSVMHHPMQSMYPPPVQNMPWAMPAQPGGMPWAYPVPFSGIQTQPVTTPWSTSTYDAYSQQGAINPPHQPAEPQQLNTANTTTTTTSDVEKVEIG